jgi:hypothetical protein
MALHAFAIQGGIFKNLSTPSVYLKAPQKISRELATRLRVDWKQNFGEGRRGSTALLVKALCG